MRGGNFLKIQWCCISKVVQLDNLVLSTELIMQIGNCKEFLRLPFCELTIILFANPSWWLVYIFLPNFFTFRSILLNFALEFISVFNQSDVIIILKPIAPLFPTFFCILGSLLFSI